MTRQPDVMLVISAAEHQRLLDLVMPHMADHTADLTTRRLIAKLINAHPIEGGKHGDEEESRTQATQGHWHARWRALVGRFRR